MPALPFLLSLLCFLFVSGAYGQGSVPPVQQQGGSFQLSPPLPNGGSQSTAIPVLQVPVQSSGIPTLNILLDHSGSMAGTPLEAARSSVLISLDLIAHWQSLYPAALQQLEIQIVAYGGSGELKVLVPLQRVDPNTVERLKEIVRHDDTQFSGTDYSTGIDHVINALGLPARNAKTLILTDAADQGSGPHRGADYQSLGDVHFIVFGDQQENIDNWLRAIPRANQLRVASPNEVTTLLVRTLFEFVDDIDTYLVRQGNARIGKGRPFRLIKHSTTAAHELIITRPDPTLQLIDVRTASGQPVSPVRYTVRHRGASFFQLVLAAGLPRGPYEITFAGDRAQTVHYINWEACSLSLRPVPPLRPTYLERESIEMRLGFWDQVLQEEVSYADFLPFTAYRYALEGTARQGSGYYSAANLRVAGSFATPRTVPVLTAWNYNRGKLLAGLPPLEAVDTIRVQKEGRLFRLYYDTLQTYEGRCLELRARAAAPDSALLQSVDALHLTINGQAIALRQSSPGRNDYRATTAPLQPGAHQLAFAPVDSPYAFGFTTDSRPAFTAHPRILHFSYTAAETAAKATLGWWESIRRIGRRRDRTHQRRHDATSHNGLLEWPIAIPFTAALSPDTHALHIQPNVLFDNETLTVTLDTTGSCYPGTPAEGGINGWGQREKERADALCVAFDRGGTSELTAPGTTVNTLLRKRAGDWHLTAPLRPEARVTVSAVLHVRQADSTITRIALPATEVILAVTTDEADRRWVLAQRWGKTLLFALVLLAICLTGMLYYVYRRVQQLLKNRHWKNIQRASPEDLLAHFPAKAKEVIQQYAAQRPDLYPLADEPEAVRQRRAARVLCQQWPSAAAQALVAAFRIGELDLLSKRLQQPPQRAESWSFRLHPGEQREIIVAGLRPDKLPDRETCIRVRRRAAASYGRFRFGRGTLHFTNEHCPVTIQNEQGNISRVLDPTETRAVSSGDRLCYTYPKHEQCFALSVVYREDRLTVTVHPGPA